MTMDHSQEIKHPLEKPEPSDWTGRALRSELLLTGKSSKSGDSLEEHKKLTAQGIIPALEIEDSGKESGEHARNKKNGGIFGNLDNNRDGAVTAKEWTDRFDQVAGRDQLATRRDFLDAFGDTSNARRLFNRANRNGDSMVSMTEWLGRFDRIESNRDRDETISKREFAASNRARQGIFAGIDADHDGELTAGEWVNKLDRVAGPDQTATRAELFKVFGRNGNTEEFFKAADADSNKKVSMTELLQLYQKLESSDRNFTINRKEFAAFKRDAGDSTEPFVGAPDLSRYESREEMEFIARLASHDQQLNGSTQPGGPQGTIFLQTLLDEQAGGTLNGQSEIFLKGDTAEQTAQRRKWFFEAMANSVDPDTGRLNGRVLSQSIVDTVYDASGMDISDSINRADHREAQTSPEALSVRGPGDTEDPRFIDRLMEHSGWSKSDIAANLLWGHAQVFSEDGEITDNGVREFLASALEGRDERTSQLIHSFPEIEQAARHILESPNPAEKLGDLFLDSQSKQFGVPIEETELVNITQGVDSNMITRASDIDRSGQSQKTSFLDRFLYDLKRAADSGNTGLIENTLNKFGDRFQSLANSLLKTNQPGEPSGEPDGDLPETAHSQRRCPFMALKDKFGSGSKTS